MIIGVSRVNKCGVYTIFIEIEDFALVITVIRVKEVIRIITVTKAMRNIFCSVY